MFHYTPEWSDAAVRRFLKRVGPEQVPALFRLRAADDAGAGTGKDSSAALRELGDRIAGILARQEALEVRDLAVSGEDVMAACGLRPGPEVGAVLGALLEAVLEDPRRNTREKLLALARERRPTS